MDVARPLGPMWTVFTFYLRNRTRMSDAEILSGTADRTFSSFTAYVTISAISELRLLPAESFRGAFFF